MYERLGVPERESLHKPEVPGPVRSAGCLRYKRPVRGRGAQAALLVSPMLRRYAPDGLPPGGEVPVDVPAVGGAGDRLLDGRRLSGEARLSTEHERLSGPVPLDEVELRR